MFIEVEADSNSITCNFINQNDTDEKFCNITYYYSKGSQTIVGNTTGNSVKIELKSKISDGGYNYTIIARNTTTTVMVKGTFRGI